MNRKAFTMIEIIFVIVIIGSILLFAIPGVTKMIENSKKDTMIIDAKDMVQKAKIYIMAGKAKYPTYNSLTLTLNQIDSRKEIKDSPFGGSYKREESFVKIKKQNSEYVFTVTLIDEKGNKIKNVDSNELNGDDRYTKVQTGE